jgi:hypothetical protein
MPANVLMLKNSVPASWMADASQSIRRGSHDAGLHRARAPRTGPRSTLTASELQVARHGEEDRSHLEGDADAGA